MKIKKEIQENDGRRINKNLIAKPLTKNDSIRWDFSQKEVEKMMFIFKSAFDSLNQMEDYLKNMLTNYEYNHNMKVADFNKIEVNKDFNIYSRMSSDGQLTLIMGVCFDVQNRKWFWWTPRTEHIDGLYDYLKAFTKIEKSNVQVTERSKKWE